MRLSGGGVGEKVGCLEAEDCESISARTNLSGGSVGERVGCLEATVRVSVQGPISRVKCSGERRKTVRVSV